MSRTQRTEDCLFVKSSVAETMTTELDKRLIFLISQPRSGSTLLQHILGGHSEVHTLPEPWLMLHAIYGLRSSGLEAEYNARLAYYAYKGFLERIPGGEPIHLEAVRRMALYLYERALEPSKKLYFLDKTPRYYLVVPELYRIFPGAKYIFLLRNPLAVLVSILEVSLGGEWMGLFTVDRKHDLLTAPRLILEGIKLTGQQAAVVHYEELVTEPERTVSDLCRRTGLSYEPDMLYYGDKVQFEGPAFVDPKSIYKHQRPVTDYLDGWVTRLNTPQKIDIAGAYLDALGADTIDSLGYPYDELKARLSSVESNEKQIVVPWHLLVTPSEELPWWDRLRLAFICSLQHRGFKGTVRRCAGFVVRGR